MFFFKHTFLTRAFCSFYYPYLASLAVLPVVKKKAMTERVQLELVQIEKLLCFVSLDFF